MGRGKLVSKYPSLKILKRMVENSFKKVAL
jgi:hypothetical protein